MKLSRAVRDDESSDLVVELPTRDRAAVARALAEFLLACLDARAPEMPRIDSDASAE